MRRRRRRTVLRPTGRTEICQKIKLIQRFQRSPGGGGGPPSPLPQRPPAGHPRPQDKKSETSRRGFKESAQVRHLLAWGGAGVARAWRGHFLFPQGGTDAGVARAVLHSAWVVRAWCRHGADVARACAATKQTNMDKLKNARGSQHTRHKLHSIGDQVQGLPVYKACRVGTPDRPGRAGHPGRTAKTTGGGGHPYPPKTRNSIPWCADALSDPDGVPGNGCCDVGATVFRVRIWPPASPGAVHLP
eukprot:gene22675-biopygen10274